MRGAALATPCLSRVPATVCLWSPDAVGNGKLFFEKKLTGKHTHKADRRVSLREAEKGRPGPRPLSTSHPGSGPAPKHWGPKGTPPPL